MISSLRVACSAPIRSAARLCSSRDLGRLDRLIGRDFRLFDRPGARNLEPAGALFPGDALGVDRIRLHDAELLRRLAGLDLGLVHRTAARDLAATRLLLVDDARFRYRALLLDARLLDVFARLNLGFLDRARALDLLLAHLALGGDARGVDRLLVGDPRLVDGFARRYLDFLDCTGTLDFPLTDVAFAGDARLADRLLVGDAGFLDGLARGNLRLLRFGLAKRALARDFRALHCAPDFDIALLVEPRRLAVALDFQRLPLRLEIAGADIDHRFLFDVVAQFPSGLDRLHQVGQALGVEAIGGIEEFEIGLVEVGDGDRFEFEPVLRERLGGGGLDARDIFAALLVHLLHRHFGGDRA